MVFLTVQAKTRTVELGSLRAWLNRDEQLRGTVEGVYEPPEPGQLGPVLDALQIVAGTAPAAITAALVAWLKSRSGAVSVTVTTETGGKVELNAANVKTMDVVQLRELLTLVAEEMRPVVPEPVEGDPNP